MALITADRVREFTSTNGTGTLTHTGAAVGYQTFSSAIGNGNTCYYAIYNPGVNEWEVGIGTVGAGILARTTVLKSSNSNNLVSFSAGTKDVFVTYPAETAVFQGGAFSAGTVTATSGVINANSATDALRITQTGAGNALVVEDSANPDSTPFVVDSSGKVLISSRTPIAALGGRTALIQYLSNDPTPPAQILSSFYSAGTNFGAELQFVASKSGVSGTFGGAIANNQTLGSLQFYGDDGTSAVSAAYIGAFVDGTPGANDMPGRLVFSTTRDGASSPTEAMRVDNQQRVGIGLTPSSSQRFAIGGSQTLGASPIYCLNQQTVQSDATTFPKYFYSYLNTQAASYTVSQLGHYVADAAALGAGSTITSQFGFFASGGLTGATNNYGFHSNIASGTGRYNFYAAGSADNYFAGNVGIGDTSLSDRVLGIGKTANGSATSYIALYSGSFQSPTTSGQTYTSSPGVLAGATMSFLQHFRAQQGAFAGTVDTQYGYHAASSLTGATNNYGFYSNIASGTGRWNFYAAGSAANYFAGDMQFAKTVTAAGTTGAQTINKTAGTVNFAAAATSLVVTNSLVTANSIIVCTVGTNDSTMKSVSAVAAAGSFTIYANAAATAETRVNFIVIN